jgi:hypothetical protein
VIAETETMALDRGANVDSSLVSVPPTGKVAAVYAGGLPRCQTRVLGRTIFKACWPLSGGGPPPTIHP